METGSLKSADWPRRMETRGEGVCRKSEQSFGMVGLIRIAKGCGVIKKLWCEVVITNSF